METIQLALENESDILRLPSEYSHYQGEDTSLMSTIKALTNELD